MRGPPDPNQAWGHMVVWSGTESSESNSGKTKVLDNILTNLCNLKFLTAFSKLLQNVSFVDKT